MLDENLPTYVLKPSSDKPKQKSTYLYSQYGADFEPAYSLRHPDPELHDSKNRYAAGLYDAFSSDVLYAEVLLVPEWMQSTLSAEQIRSSGGVPPPPEPIIPTEFTIQLYNPDQQVVVTQKPGSWNSAPSWSFEMPQQTFRTPSASILDRTQHDPTASETTPKIRFTWKKDSKLSKDLACFLSGKSTNLDGSKKKNKEPDITVAIFKGLKEITLYEPNLQRVEIEDMKGFEVVLLLGAVVLRDVYFGHIKETFNIAGANTTSPKPTGLVLASGGLLASRPRPSTPGAAPMRDPRVPPTDPRSQWEIDAETARLKRIAMEEERARRTAEEADQRRIKKMLKNEEEDKRRQQAEIDRETERLQRLYGQEDLSARPALPTRPHEHRHSFDPAQSAYMQSQPQYQAQYQQQPQYGQPPSPWGGGGYVNHPYMSGAQPSQSGYLGASGQQQGTVKPKSSFFGLRRSSDDRESKLRRKRSAVF